MPKDNNQTQNPQNNTAPVADDMPPIMMEDTHPPMINESDQTTVISDQSSPITSHQSPVADSGSAAPADDIVMPSVVTSGPNVKSPTKKFGGGKVIATILGLFLLVGGVGAGVMLTQQNQDIREQASGGCSGNTSKSSCESSCGSPKADGKTYSCRWSSESGECKESGNICGTGADSGTTTKGACEAGGGIWCDKVVENNGNPIPGFCTPPNITCGSTAVSLGYDLSGTVFDPDRNYVSDACKEYVNLSSGCVTVDTPTASFNCPDQSLSGSLGGCSQNAGTSKCLSASACGTQQIDFKYNGVSCYLSKYRECNNDTSTNPPATNPPAISAVCQDVKAYSETWTLLTNAQLSQLKAGNKVNFCVTGSASSGSFNKARFTINGGLQPETTTVRPSGTDFCQNYTIPAGTTNFVVIAQINHITLGWK